MWSDNPQKPESVKIPYDREELNEMVKYLFDNKNSDPAIKKETSDRIVSIEEKINTIKEYQTAKYSKNYYSSIEKLLLEIKNSVSIIYDNTKRYNESLSKELRTVILGWIKPLENALKRTSIPYEMVLKTKRLYAQQSLVSRDITLRKKLIQHLNEIGKLLSEPDKLVLLCCFSYAWPSEERKEEEYWVQPFLYVLYDHLTEAGIQVVMDIRDNEPGESIVAFTKKYKDANYIILVGTQSLLERYYDKRSHVLQDQLTIIQKRIEQDDRSRIYPLLISGTKETAYPDWYWRFFHIKDGRESDYLKMLKDLITWFYDSHFHLVKKEKEYDFLWNNYFELVRSLLPIEKDAVDQEIAKDYHRQNIDNLKQYRKIQGNREECSSEAGPSSICMSEATKHSSMVKQLTPQFEQFSVQSGKSEKEAGKEEEIMEANNDGWLNLIKCGLF